MILKLLKLEQPTKMTKASDSIAAFWKNFNQCDCSKWSNCCWEPNVQGMWTCSINIQIWRTKQLFTVALFNLWIWMQGKLFKDLLTHFHSLEKKCLDFAHTTKLTWSNISFKLTIMQMMQHLMQKLYNNFLLHRFFL